MGKSTHEVIDAKQTICWSCTEHLCSCCSCRSVISSNAIRECVSSIEVCVRAPQVIDSDHLSVLQLARKVRRAARSVRVCGSVGRSARWRPAPHVALIVRAGRRPNHRPGACGRRLFIATYALAIDSHSLASTSITQRKTSVRTTIAILQRTHVRSGSSPSQVHPRVPSQSTNSLVLRWGCAVVMDYASGNNNTTSYGKTPYSCLACAVSEYLINCTSFLLPLYLNVRIRTTQKCWNFASDISGITFLLNFGN